LNTVTRQRRTNELDEMETTIIADNTTKMTAAQRGAALKREKNAAAKVARAAGKVAAAGRRATQEQERAVRRGVIAEETALIDRRVAAARVALGVAPGDPNPSSICLLIEMLTAEMQIRLSEKGFW
jgi:hypothetical protein